MILSFHPMLIGDENRIVAGRPAGAADQAAIDRADAVILPQGCREDLYRMATTAGLPVFPDYRIRFDYPGKRGQARLFQETGAAAPSTASYPDLAAFQKQTRNGRRLPIPLPLVVKLDWGGEGETVFFAKDIRSLDTIIGRLSDFEKSGQPGFLIQEFIPSGNRCLRLGVIGKRIDTYWRIQPESTEFSTALSRGGHIDYRMDPDLQKKAVGSARQLCKKTGIDLAGFDFLFDCRLADPPALFLEINWFFGRIGYGGSDRFYALLKEAADDWLAGLPILRKKAVSSAVGARP